MKGDAFRAVVRRAEGEADLLLRAVGAHDAALLRRLDDLAELLGIEVSYGGITGAAARLVKRRDGRRILRVRAEDEGTPRGRFSIAHELGHHRLHVGESEAWCTSTDMGSWEGGGKRLREAEANAFAAAFLLPRALVAERCDTEDISFAVPRALATEFDVSLTAAAIRFARLSPLPCAVVRATEGTIDFAMRNDEFWPWVHARGERLHTATLAFDCHRDGRQRHDDPEGVPAYGWIDGDLPEDLEVVEHTIYRPKLKETLTLLWLRGWPSEEEMEELREEM